jgi:hypothetical protein
MVMLLAMSTARIPQVPASGTAKRINHGKRRLMAGEADAEFIISFKHLGRLNL